MLRTFNAKNRILLGILFFLIIISVGYIAFLNSEKIQSYFHEVFLSQDSNVKKKLIVVISMDGMGSTLLGEDTPFLESILTSSETSYTLDMRTISQSETMPSHISMITGLTQEHHGFYANSVDDSTPTFTNKTIFDYGVQNNYSYYAFLTKDKLLYLLGDKTGSNIISEEKYSSDVLNDIDNLVESNNSNTLVFIHLRDVDSYGHSFGWGSVEQEGVIKTLDHNLELIVSDLRNEFNSYDRYFIFTADHGGEGIQHANGCVACRRIPLIIVSDNPKSKYVLKSQQYSIYDVTCVVLDLMDAQAVNDLDCKMKGK